MGAAGDGFDRTWAVTSLRVRGYARSRLSAADADDVVAEVYLTAWRNRDRIPERSLPWLLGVARNVIARTVDQSRRDRGLVEAIARVTELGARGPDPADVVGERLAVLSVLSTLGELDREVLLLAAWDGLTSRDAGAVLGCTGAAYAVRLHRARGRFARALTAYDHPTRASGPAPIHLQEQE